MGPILISVEEGLSKTKSKEFARKPVNSPENLLVSVVNNFSDTTKQKLTGITKRGFQGMLWIG